MDNTKTDEATTARRPVQNFIEMGFSPGDKVVFRDFPDENITLADGRSFLWEGHHVSLNFIRNKLGARLGTSRYYGPLTIADRPVTDAYDETYGALEAKAPAARASPSSTGLTFKDVVPSPSDLMGVKAVWGPSIAPVMCFGSRSASNPHQIAADVAKKADTAPLLLTIGGGAKVPKALAGRVLEVVRVSRAYGATNALVVDPEHRKRLEQWPSSIVLLEVYTLIGAPDLINDLRLPDRKVLTLAFDTVKTDHGDLQALWSALKDWPVARNRQMVPPVDFKNPASLNLVGTLYPRYSKDEGREVWKASLERERDKTLRPILLKLNQQANGGRYVCEACDFTHDRAAMFDAHHLYPLFHGERLTRVDDLALLCPTCHRAAHRLAADPSIPLNIDQLRHERLGIPTLPDNDG